MNLYRYVNSNPVNYVDPSGLYGAVARGLMGAAPGMIAGAGSAWATGGVLGGPPVAAVSAVMGGIAGGIGGLIAGLMMPCDASFGEIAAAGLAAGLAAGIGEGITAGIMAWGGAAIAGGAGAAGGAGLGGAAAAAGSGGLGAAARAAGGAAGRAGLRGAGHAGGTGLANSAKRAGNVLGNLMKGERGSLPIPGTGGGLRASATESAEAAAKAPVTPGAGSKALDQLESIEEAQRRIREGTDAGRRIIDSIEKSKQRLNNQLRGTYDPKDWM